MFAERIGKNQEKKSTVIKCGVRAQRGLFPRGEEGVERGERHILVECPGEIKGPGGTINYRSTAERKGNVLSEQLCGKRERGRPVRRGRSWLVSGLKPREPRGLGN